MNQGQPVRSAAPARSKGRVEKSGAKIEEHVLANGMHVLLAERHLDPVVAVMVWYRVGSRNETEREAGVSHFLEHMMFKGSRRFGKGMVDQLTTQLGGTNNAFTTSDHTAYWFELASDRWEKALEIEADRMRHLLLDAREFDAEKQVVLEELAMGEDDPWRMLSQEVQAALVTRHPYRRPVIGYKDTLERLSVGEMREYYERFYHPGNATLVVCGDIDPKRALERVRALFDSIPAGKPFAEADPVRAPLSEPRGEQRFTLRWDDDARRLCIAWPTVKVGEDDDYALDLASTLFTGGRLSRLYRKLVIDERLATSVSTHNDTRVEGGAFWLFAECAQGAKPEQLERAIDAEIERLAREKPALKELERTKRMLVAGEAYDSETVSDIAEELGEFAVDLDWRVSLTTMARIEATSGEAVRATVARLLKRDRRVVGWCLSKKELARGKGSQRQRARAKDARSFEIIDATEEDE